MAKRKNCKREIDLRVKEEEEIRVGGEEEEEDQWGRRVLWEVVQFCFYFSRHRPCPRHVPALFVIFKKKKEARARVMPNMFLVSYTCWMWAQQPKCHVCAFQLIPNNPWPTTVERPMAPWPQCPKRQHPQLLAAKSTTTNDTQVKL